MKVLLVYPPILRSAGIYSTPLPIGVLQVAGYLWWKGNDVRVLNLEIGGALKTVSIAALRRAYELHDPTRYVANPGSAYRTEFHQALLAHRPDLVGFSCATEQLDAAQCLAEDAMRILPGVRIEMGGVAAKPSEWASETARIALDHDPALSKLAGQNPPESFGAILTSHGCPHACTFCSSPSIYGRRVTEYPPERLFLRINDAAAMGAKRIHLMDDTITLRLERAREVADVMAAARLPWRTQTRVDDLARHPELAAELKSRGCTQLTFGVESGSPRLLELMKKRITRDQVLRAVEILDKAQLPYTANFMIGYPGETDDDVQLTIDLIDLMRPQRVLAGSVVPYPGSELHNTNPEFVARARRWPACRWSPFDPGFLCEDNGDRVQGPSAAAIKAFYDLVERVNDHAPTPGTFTTSLKNTTEQPAEASV
ncbi:MAG: radical SAM protein [Phycisphaerae bacterium]|nr:radical SAM protein [Phycisphaerae bacterium]